jgi:hypothetical protein
MADKTGYIGRNPGDSSVKVARQTFTPSTSTTDFTFAAGYTVGYVDLYLNGAKLIEGTDFNANDGITISMVSAAADGDVLEAVAYKAFNVGDSSSSSTGNFTVGNDLTVDNNATITNDLNVLGIGTVAKGFNVSAGGINAVGVITATSYEGDGSSLTGLQAGYFVETQAGIHTLSNVGLGTTNPSTMLMIEGDASSNATLSFDRKPVQSTNDGVIGDILFSNNGDSVAQIAVKREVGIDDGYIQINTQPNGGTFSEKIRIAGDGDVGIGTTRPLMLTHLFFTNNDTTWTGGSSGSWGSNGLRIENHSLVAGSHATLQLRTGQGADNIIASEFMAANRADLVFQGDSGSSPNMNEQLRITGLGNSVGIGTSLPSGHVEIFKQSSSVFHPDKYNGHISGLGTANGNTGDIFLSNKNNTAGNYNDITFSTLGDSTVLYEAAKITAFYPDHGGANPSGELYFQTKADAGDLKTGLFIDRDRNVGIGTTVIVTGSNLTVSGNLYPRIDATHDLGSGSYRWANIYSADLQLSNEGKQNEVDGTWGKYTIQEGEDDLFLINRRTGKKYKFMLEEVQ